MRRRLSTRMKFLDFKVLVIICVVFSFFSLVFFSCTRSPSLASSKFLTILIDTPPETLNPRLAMDAVSQRLEMLLYSGIVSLNSNLEPVPDLVESWTTSKDGKRLTFKVKTGLKDHAGLAISAQDLDACLHEYLEGKPTSPQKSSFPKLKTITSNPKKNELILDLESPDPYLIRNLVLLRFFRRTSDGSVCKEPQSGELLIQSGAYDYGGSLSQFSQSFVLHSTETSRPDLKFTVIRDETSRVLKLLDGEIDVALNPFSQSKLDWLLARTNRYTLFSRSGTTVSYLAFNLKNPILKNLKVRRAIAQGINRKEILEKKLRGITSIAGSFLAPELPESFQTFLEYQPEVSKALLDEAGFPVQANGFRFTLHYKTTPTRDGIEMAQILQSQLQNLGIKIEVDIVDIGVYLNQIKAGNFDLYNSRWVGVADGSIFYKTLFSESPDNRVHYTSLELDQWLEQSQKTLDLEKRKSFYTNIQRKMLEDLPYFPLWFWTNNLLLGKSWEGIGNSDVSLSGGFQPLQKIQQKR